MSAHRKKNNGRLCVSVGRTLFFLFYFFFYADSYTVSVSDLDSESYFFLFYLYAKFFSYLIYKECVDIVSIFVCCLFMRICHICFVEIFAVLC